jgi:hypothetical protein
MYLDPGFGSMVIQLVIGSIAAGGTFLFLFREKIKKLFGISAQETVEEKPVETSSEKKSE